MPAQDAFRKGDRVEWTDKGRTVVGTVAKGGRVRITVIVDGGKQEVRGHKSPFRPSTVPLPADEPGPMDGYGVAGYRSLGGEETDNFTARVCLGGRPILHARNSGTGGCNSYDLVRGVEPHVRGRFFAAARDWNNRCGGPFADEAADIWMSWWLHGRPYGVTAKMYLNDAARQG